MVPHPFRICIQNKSPHLRKYISTHYYKKAYYAIKCFVGLQEKHAAFSYRDHFRVWFETVKEEEYDNR